MSNVLTVKELASYLGFTPRTIYLKAQVGEIPGVKIGRNWRFPKEMIDEWLNREAEKTANTQREQGKNFKDGEIVFGTHHLGEIKGRLSREEMYDYL